MCERNIIYYRITVFEYNNKITMTIIIPWYNCATFFLYIILRIYICSDTISVCDDACIKLLCIAKILNVKCYKYGCPTKTVSMNIIKKNIEYQFYVLIISNIK